LKKISEKLKGKPKTKEHIAKLVGHIVTDETREKLRNHNLGKSASIATKQKMSQSRIGKTKAPMSIASKLNIAASKMEFRIKTPFGIFNSFLELSIATNVPSRSWIVVFNRNLDKVPKSKLLSKCQLSNSDKLTWRELGFDKLVG
jgi:hypothetical protein